MLRTTSAALRTATLLTIVILLLAACGPGAGASSAGASSAPSAGPSAGPSASPAAGETYTVNAVNDATLGAYLTGEGDRTLYILTTDSAGTSTCTGGCADSWPPFTLEEDDTVAGAAGVSGTFGTIARDDGSRQVTYEGLPLYYFSGDAAAGDTNGQGINNVWFVAPVAGAATTSSPSPGRGNY